MNGRVVTLVLVLAVVALVAATMWDPDEHRDVLPSAEAPDERTAPADSAPRDTVAEDARRDAVDAPVAATSAALAFIGRVQDGAGQPIEGVRVELQGARARGRIVVASASTHADGSFLLPTEQAMPGTLQFIAHDHVDAARAFVLPGEFVVVRLVRGIAISGRVVERSDRAPVADATITRQAGQPEALIVAGELAGASAFVRTDASGRFAIVVPRVPALVRAQKHGRGSGCVVVTAVADSVEIELPGDSFEPGLFFRVVDRDTKEPIDGVTVEPGPAQPQALGMVRATTNWYGRAVLDAPGHLRKEWGRAWGLPDGENAEHAIVVELAAATSITGILLDDQGQAIEGAVVVVQLDDAPLRELDRGSGFDESRARSDAIGRFVVEDVPIAAKLRLRAEHGGTVVAEKRGIEVPSRDPFDCGPLRSEGGSETLEVSVSRTSGEPAVGAVVRGFGDGRIRVAQTDAQGLARFDRAARIQTVLASGAECAPAWTAIDWTTHDVRVTLALGPPGHIGGVVRDATGAAYPDAFVIVDLVTNGAPRVASEQEPGDGSLASGSRATRTDASGRFAFDGLRVGDYRVRAFQSDMSVNILGGSGRGLPRPVETHTGRDDIEFVLPATGTIVLHVTTRDSRRACDRFKYSFHAGDVGYETTISDSNGYVTQGMNAGAPIRIGVEAGGFAPRHLDVPALAALEVRLVDVELDREAELSGTVRLADGSLGAFAQVSSDSKETGHESGFAVADANGVFKIVGLASGEHRLSASVRSERAEDELVPMLVDPATVTLAVGETQQRDLRLTYADGGPLDLTFDVRDLPAGTDAVRIEIRLEPTDGRRAAHRSNAHNGATWRIPGLGVATYAISGMLTLRTTADGSKRQTWFTCEPATIDVTPGAMAVTLTLRAK